MLHYCNLYIAVALYFCDYIVVDDKFEDCTAGDKFLILKKMPTKKQLLVSVMKMCDNDIGLESVGRISM